MLTIIFTTITACIAAGVLIDMYNVQVKAGMDHRNESLLYVYNRLIDVANNGANNMVIQLNANRAVSLKKINEGELDREQTNYIYTVAGNNLNQWKDFSSFHVLLDNGYLFSAEKNRSLSLVLVENMQPILSVPVDAGGTFVHMDAAPFHPESIYYCKQLRDIEYNEPIGRIMLEISPETLERLSSDDEFSSTVVFDENRELLLATGDLRDLLTVELPEGKDGAVRLAGHNYFYTSNIVPKSNWQIVSLVNEDTVVGQISKVTAWLVLTALSIIVLMSLLSSFMVRKFAKPIRELSDHMIKSTGSLPIALEVPQKHDEIENLYSSFNEMLKQNQTLFENLKEEHNQKIVTELALVQSQIKPHFLYNTLDTIYCLSAMNRMEEAARVTKALADYYRQVLNNGSDLITIGKEVVAVEQYLMIMQMRFSQLLHYSIECDSQVKDLLIPKLLIQPIIENAIEHGIKPKQAPGTVEVRIVKEDNRVILSVADDGIGMSAEQFEKVLSGEISFNDEESFGLNNIQLRLKMFFGEKSSLMFERKQEKTVVSIVLDLTEDKHV